MSTDSINIHTEEEYHDPKSGGTFSNIGQVKYVQRYFCGRLADATNIDGVDYPSGPVYVGPKTNGESRDAIKNRALEACKETGKKFPEWVALTSMPTASITNIPAETRAEFTFPVLQSHCRIVALNPKRDVDAQDNAIGFHLLLLPSVVDAFARFKGWYTEPLFNPQACQGIGQTEDAKFVIPTLVGFRTAIWKALGESDWMAMYETTQAPKLKEALALARNPWDAYVRTVRLNNPAKNSYYAKKDKPDEFTRQSVACVTQFFSGEKDAIEVGAKELAERGGDAQASNGKVTAEQFAALLPKTSAKAQVFGADFASVAEAIYKDLGADPKKASKPQVIKVAKEYEVEVGDVELIRNL